MENFPNALEKFGDSLMLSIKNCHKEYSYRLYQWRKIRDAISGEDCIKDEGEYYLPKPSGMTTPEYAAYKLRAMFYPVAERTLRGLSGLVFRHRPVITLPERLKPMERMATTEGFTLEILIEEILREVLSIGRYGMLLDMPTNSPSGSAPVIATYFAEDIRDWMWEYENGFMKLKKVILEESSFYNYQESGSNGRYMELTINKDGHYEVRKWMVDKANEKESEMMYEDPSVPLVNGEPLTEIPFFFVNS